MGKQSQAAETCKASSVQACLTRCFTADNPPAQLPASGKKLRLKDGLRAPAHSRELHWQWDQLEGCLLSLLTAWGHKEVPSARVVLQMRKPNSLLTFLLGVSPAPKASQEHTGGMLYPYSTVCKTLQKEKSYLTFNWQEDVLVRTALALQSPRFAAVKWHYCTEVFSAFRQIKACSKQKNPITAFAEALTQAIDLILFNVCHQISLSLSQYGINFYLIPACLNEGKAD